ncbi:MAG: tRNA (guanosine(46)-N7)-methyltransferase TrmB [Bacteroidota bacterium]
MAKKKLIHFQENLTFPHLFQPSYHELDNGFALRSKWQEAYFANDRPIIVELGCGKGEYTVGLASKHPKLNYIGIDLKGSRLWRGCKSVIEGNLKNVAFVRTRVDHIGKIFAPGEISAIWITFPDPQQSKERLRLTSPGFLEKYSNVLSPGGIIHLKTDDVAFYLYSIDVIKKLNHQILWNTDDLYHSGTDDEVIHIQTYYEEKWLEMGKKICYVRFKLNNL